MRRRWHHLAIGVALLGMGAMLAGCGNNGPSELNRWVSKVQRRPAGRIPPVPKMTIAPGYTYDAFSLRSPFLPAESEGNSVRPNFHRRKQYLENFPLDSLSFVGEVTMGGATYALIEDPKGMVHRVTVGDYLGQNNGRIVSILPGKIRISEIVPNGFGGWERQPASLSLGQNSGG